MEDSGFSIRYHATYATLHLEGSSPRRKPPTMHHEASRPRTPTGNASAVPARPAEPDSAILASPFIAVAKAFYAG